MKTDMVTTQLELFEQPAPLKKRKQLYNDLTIHQKINYKANMCGFSHLVYGMYYQYGYQHLDIRYYPIDRLNDRYAWHYKHNSGGFNRLDRYVIDKLIKAIKMNKQLQLFDGDNSKYAIGRVFKYNQDWTAEIIQESETHVLVKTSAGDKYCIKKVYIENINNIPSVMRAHKEGSDR
jgi:hypothetical protein